MKKWYVAVLLGTSLGTLAADASSMKDTSSSKAAPAPALKHELSLYEMFDNHNVNLGLRADLLYMVYNAPVSTYATNRRTGTLENNALHTKDTEFNSTVQNARGKLSVGCNLALSYTMHDRPGYTFETSWFHIVAQFNNSFESDTVLPAHAASLTKSAPGKASVYGHQNINLFDLVAKKSFAFGDWVGVTPLAGLVGGYLNGVSTSHYNATSGSFQDTSGQLSAVNNAYLNYDTKFEGIGVKLGLNSSFKIWSSFSFKADFAYNVMYGLARSTLAFSQSALDANGVYGTHSAYSNHQARSFVDALLGFAWASHFDHNRCYFDIHAGWRYQSYFTGLTTFGNDSATDLNASNYAGQGLQVGATFKF